MSNVLIGIIGVILFIGLALAGALILGDDFRSSTNESKAAALVQQLHQTGNAVDMYELKTGNTMAAGTAVTTLVPRFLKVAPNNPTVGGGAAAILGPQGQASGNAGIVVMSLGTNADPICLAIVEQTGGGSAYVTAATAAQIPSAPVGCFRTSAVIGGLATATFYAYVRT